MVVLQRQPGEIFGFSLRNAMGGLSGMQVARIAPNSPAAAAQRQGLLNVGDYVDLADGLPPAQFLAQPELFTKGTVVTLRIDPRYRANSDYAKSVTLLNWTGLLGFGVFVGCTIALALRVFS